MHSVQNAVLNYAGGLISFASTVVFLLHLEHTGAYTLHPVRIKMEEFADVRFKQRAVIEFLTA
jgi:hypothetical protein